MLSAHCRSDLPFYYICRQPDIFLAICRTTSDAATMTISKPTYQMPVLLLRPGDDSDPPCASLVSTEYEKLMRRFFQPRIFDQPRFN
ncbi:hypothetical protein ACU8KH_02398 [Lachancea thermotolerans]